MKINHVIILLLLMLGIGTAFGWLITKTSSTPITTENRPVQYWEKPFTPKNDTSKSQYSYSSTNRNDLKPIEPWYITSYPQLPTTPIAQVSSYKDSLVQIIDSLNGTIQTLSLKFLTYYQTSSKLVGGFFTKDTIRLDLFNPDGSIQSKHYPVYYPDFDYEWRNNGMFVKVKDNPIKPQNQSKNIQSDLSTNISYLTYASSLSLGLDYRFQHKKIILQTSLDYFIEPKTPSIQAKIGYKLY